MDSLLQQGLLVGSLPVQLVRHGLHFSGVVGVVSLQAAHLLLLGLICCSLLSSRLSACLHQPATWSMQSAINPWAAGHNAWLVIKLMPKGILFSCLLHAVSLIGARQVTDDLACCCCCYVMQYGRS